MSQVDSTGKDHTLLDTFDDLISNHQNTMSHMSLFLHTICDFICKKFTYERLRDSNMMSYVRKLLSFRKSDMCDFLTYDITAK